MGFSTVLRDNKYSTDTGIGGGSCLDNGERSHLLQQAVLRIGDVAPHEAVGHIAVATVGDAMPLCPLRKGRLYDSSAARGINLSTKLAGTSTNLP